ncbi:hypothetical protein ACFVMC_02120 [Nocardia sp. NPDC127579]|uniref:hypothetical protein n=1 Tax=Nocardia sp. NPDC127579 TaxID=3345402 RepID=UPI00364421C8
MIRAAGSGLAALAAFATIATVSTGVAGAEPKPTVSSEQCIKGGGQAFVISGECVDGKYDGSLISPRR